MVGSSVVSLGHRRERIDVNESKFALGFGQPHRAVRLLDSNLLRELALPYDEMSLPLRSIASLPVKDTTVLIVENGLNLLTFVFCSRNNRRLEQEKLQQPFVDQTLSELATARADKFFR